VILIGLLNQLSSTLELFVPSYHLTTIAMASLVSCCSRHRLEHIACLCPVITIYLKFSPTDEDILVSTVISRLHYVTSLTMLSWTSKWLLLF